MHISLGLPTHVVIVLSLLLVACTQNNNHTQRNQAVLNYKQSDLDYTMIIDKIKQNTATAGDFDTLIRVFPLTSLYAPNNGKEQAIKLQSQLHMENQDWQRCLAVNQSLLANNYVSLTAHYGASICAAEQGNLELGRFHNRILDSLIEAIWRTGDAKTPQTALYVTSTNDLYAFIQLHQLIAVGQSLVYVNQLPVQVMQVQNPSTLRVTTWHFDLTPQFRRGLIDTIESKP